MSKTPITRDELLILLRDTFVDLNFLVQTLRDAVFENLDDILNALVQKNSTKNPNPPKK